MRFDWDQKKAVSNQIKHKITFDQAITAFDDPYALIAPDAKHSTEHEMREWLIGEADAGVLVVLRQKVHARSQVFPMLQQLQPFLNVQVKHQCRYLKVDSQYRALPRVPALLKKNQHFTFFPKLPNDSYRRSG